MQSLTPLLNTLAAALPGKGQTDGANSAEPGFATLLDSLSSTARFPAALAVSTTLPVTAGVVEEAALPANGTPLPPTAATGKILPPGLPFAAVQPKPKMIDTAEAAAATDIAEQACPPESPRGICRAERDTKVAEQFAEEIQGRTDVPVVTVGPALPVPAVLIVAPAGPGAATDVPSVPVTVASPHSRSSHPKTSLVGQSAPQSRFMPAANDLADTATAPTAIAITVAEQPATRGAARLTVAAQPERADQPAVRAAPRENAGHTQPQVSLPQGSYTRQDHHGETAQGDHRGKPSPHAVSPSTPLEIGQNTIVAPAQSVAQATIDPTLAANLHATSAHQVIGHAVSAAPQPVQDLGQIVDRLFAAREAFAPASAELSIDHGEFGELSLRFDQRDDGRLSVAIAARNDEAHRAVAAALAADRNHTAGEQAAQPALQQQQGSAQARSGSAERDNAAGHGAANGGTQGQARQDQPRSNRTSTGGQPDAGGRSPSRGGIFA